MSQSRRWPIAALPSTPRPHTASSQLLRSCCTQPSNMEPMELNGKARIAKVNKKASYNKNTNKKLQVIEML